MVYRLYSRIAFSTSSLADQVGMRPLSDQEGPHPLGAIGLEVTVDIIKLLPRASHNLLGLADVIPQLFLAN